MKLAMSKTREQFPLSRRKVIKKTFTSIIIGGGLGLILLVAGVITNPSASDLGKLLIVAGLFLLAIIPLTYFYQLWYFAVYYYDLNNDYIVIRKGPITPSEITIPYERIQDVYVDQDLLDRFFGLYDVHLSSATISSGMSAHIDGLEKAAADGIRAVLLQTVQQRISKHRGPDVLPGTPPPAPKY